MVKKSLIVASLLLAGTSAVAGDFFVGANLVHAKATAKASVNLTGGSATLDGTTYNAPDSASYSSSDSDNNLNIKFGIDEKNARYYIQTGNLYDVDNVKYSSTTLNYEVKLEPFSGVTPFVGAHIGRGKVTVASASKTGSEYGLQAGILKNINNNLQFETGFRYTKSNISASYSIVNDTSSGTYNGHSYSTNNADMNLKAEITHITALYIGINYKF